MIKLSWVVKILKTSYTIYEGNGFLINKSNLMNYLYKTGKPRYTMSG